MLDLSPEDLGDKRVFSVGRELGEGWWRIDWYGLDVLQFLVGRKGEGEGRMVDKSIPAKFIVSVHSTAKDTNKVLPLCDTKKIGGFRYHLTLKHFNN